MEFTVANRIQGVQGSIIRELFKQMADPSIIAFAGGNPAPTTFPTADIARIAADILQREPVSVLQYGFSEGYPPLRETLKRRLTATEGIDFSSNELFIISGAQQAADLTTKVLVNEGDVILTEEPSFIGCLNAFRSYGAKLVGIPMEADGLNLQQLEQALQQHRRVRFLYIIPNFQNPTGFTTSLEKRQAIYRLAQQYDIAIFEDDPYGELRYAGEPVPSIKSLDTDGRVIYAGSFSKVMAPAFRLGYVVFDRGLVAKMTVAKQCTDVHSNLLFQRIADQLINQSDFEGHLQAARQLYRHKSSLMIEAMQQTFHQAVSFNQPQGGLFVMAFLPPGTDSFPFVQEALRRKVACVPGIAFAIDQSIPSNGFRMSYSTATDEDIVRGMEILGQLTHEWVK
ncbi:MAG: PLP-dependent aminotransferase family protein [Bacillota bacterium]|jgi:2-aminoadipate transaminase